MFPLKNGSRGKTVRVLQYGLGLTTDGIFGPNTAKGLKAWQKKMSIPQTGRMTETIWNTIFQFEIQDMKHLKFAELFKSIREEDVDMDGTPDNRSEIIDVMIKSVWEWWEPEDNKAGPPWCAIFISYCLYAAYSFPFESPRVKEWYEYLKDHEDALELKSKDDFKKDRIYIGGYLNEQGYGHVFFVNPMKSLSQTGEKIIATIEGNTNEGGSREGNGVYERQRKLEKYWVYSIPADI